MPRSPTDTIHFLTLDELGRLLTATRGSVRDRALFLLAYRHGLRASEVGLLRAEDLDLRTLRLMVHRLKGSHSGAHPLQPDEAKAIRAWLHGCGNGPETWATCLGSRLPSGAAMAEAPSAYIKYLRPNCRSGARRRGVTLARARRS